MIVTEILPLAEVCVGDIAVTEDGEFRRIQSIDLHSHVITVEGQADAIEVRTVKVLTQKR